jgi:antirestriction protein ArdC
MAGRPLSVGRCQGQRRAEAARSFTNWPTPRWQRTGRLDRDLGRCAFGSPDYAKEELRAEIAQVTICAEFGIAECEFSNSAAYLKSWCDILRGDGKEIFRATAEAQRIVDYLLALLRGPPSKRGEHHRRSSSDSGRNRS